MFQKRDIKSFFDVILKGESKTYNDHNYYTNNGLKSYIEGGYGTKYPKISRSLSDYTIGEIQSFQSRSRDNIGQLWATGRYQIIPDTLKSLVSKSGLSLNDKYSPENQDKLALQLMMGRSNIKNYLTKIIPDTKENLEKASLSMAQIWSSIGVPYAMQGSRKWIDKNESYYSGGGDKATVKTETVQNELRKLRDNYKKVDVQQVQKQINRGFISGTSIIVGSIMITGIIVYMSIYHKDKLPKFMK